MCPCYSLRVGAFLVTLALGAAVWAQPLFGVDSLAVAHALIEGTLPPGVSGLDLIIWGAVLLAGVQQFVMGLRAALSHADPLNVWSLAWSAGVIWLVLHTLWDLHPGELPADDYAALHALYLAWVAESIANIWLQLRGVLGVVWRLFVRRHVASAIEPDPVILGIYQQFAAQIRHIEAERDQAAADRNRLAAERDRLARDLKHMPAPSREVERLLGFPGVARAVLAALHPDRAPKSEAEQRAATARFQQASAVLEKMGVRR